MHTPIEIELLVLTGKLTNIRKAARIFTYMQQNNHENNETMIVKIQPLHTTNVKIRE